MSVQSDSRLESVSIAFRCVPRTAKCWRNSAEETEYIESARLDIITVPIHKSLD
jgi:hypothetical protein